MGEKKKVPTIGLALIARNEEKDLEGCINSCKGVDQISLVDTGSVDKTVEIARSMGCIVSEGEFNWPDPPDFQGIDFSAARNRSIELLSTDWFIFLDVDERVDKGHIWNIKATLRDINEKADAVLCKMYTEKGDTFWREKILRNDPSVRFVGRVHEAINNETLNAAMADNIRIHYTPRGNSMRNYAILREEILTGNNVNEMRLQYLMGREEFCWGNVPSACYWLERYWRNYQLSGKTHAMRSADALFTLSMSHARMNDLKQAKYYAALCIAINPDFKEAAMVLADIAALENNGLAQSRWLEMSKTAQNRGLSFVAKHFEYQKKEAA